MPELGDYVSRLVCDASRYKSGTDMAVAGNRELGGSVQNIIGQLTRQQRELENAGRSTRDWIALDQRASAEAKEHAHALLEQVSALKAVKSATDELIAADKKRQADSKAPGSMTSRLNTWQQEHNDPFQRGMSRMKQDEQARLAELQEAGKRRVAAGKALDDEIARQEQINADQRARDAKSRADRDLYELEGMSARKARRLRKDEENVRAQLESSGYFKRQGDRDPTTVAGSGGGGRQMALMAGIYGVQDFVAGYQYGGIRGGIMGASNNISQMGAAFGPTGMAVGGAIAAATLLGSVAYDAWKKHEEGANSATKAIKEFNANLGKSTEQAIKLHDSRLRESRLGRVETSEDAKRQREQLSDESNSLGVKIKAREQATRAMLAGVGAVGPGGQLNADQLQAMLVAGQDQARIGQMEAVGLNQNGLIWGRGMQTVHAAGRNQDFINQLRTSENELFDLKRDKERIDRMQPRAKEIEEKRRRDELDEVANQMADERAQSETELEDRRTRAREYVSREMLGLATRDPYSGNGKGGRALGIESEYRDRQLKINAAFDQGAFGEGPEADAKRKDALDRAERERMQQHRDLKYGDMQSDGATGFSSADIRSSTAMNQVMRAMRQTNENQQIAELKRNGDVSEQIKTAIDKLTEITKDTATEYVVF